jgi:hypothetical protein
MPIVFDTLISLFERNGSCHALPAMLRGGYPAFQSHIRKVAQEERRHTIIST